MQTAVAEMPEADWRKTMPLWAHMVWWERMNSPAYKGNKLVGFTDYFEDEHLQSGYIVVESSNGYWAEIQVSRRK